MLLCPQRTHAVPRQLHVPASLVVEAQNRGHHISAGAGLECGSQFLRVAYPASAGSGSGTESGGETLLRHKGLHLHIDSRHERPGGFAQVYNFFPLVDVESLGRLWRNFKRNQTRLYLQRHFELRRQRFPTLLGSAEYAQTSLFRQIILLGHLGLQNLR